MTTKTQFIPRPYGNGFTVELDGGLQRHIDATGTVVFGDVTAGVHVVRLLGLSGGCGFFTSPSYYTRTVNVTSGSEVEVTFSVVCIG